MSPARAGVHTDAAECQSVKRTPSAASALRRGVSFGSAGVTQFAPRSPHPYRRPRPPVVEERGAKQCAGGRMRGAVLLQSRRQEKLSKGRQKGLTMSSAWIKSKFGRAGGAASPSPTRSKLKTTAVRAILQSRGTCRHQYLGRVWKLKGIRRFQITR